MLITEIPHHLIDASESTLISTIISNQTQVSEIETSTTIYRSSLECSFAPGLTVGSREIELECCAERVEMYHSNWLSSGWPLTRYLETLNGWNCPQLQQECEQRLFEFNTFTELMYDFMCRNNTYFEKCLPKLTQQFSSLFISDNVAACSLQNQNFSNADFNKCWQRILNQIQPATMSIEELLEPCIQVAQFAKSERNETFQEVIDFSIPSCSISWCGFSAEAIRAHEISIGSCLEPRYDVS